MFMKFVTAAIFFLSGASTLIYQVVWQRVLTQEIGVDFVSTAIVVTIFMVGLGFGALGGGYITERYKQWLPYIYATIEILIGIYGLVSIALIRGANGFVNNTLGAQSVFIDFVANGIVLVVPIFLMGITTPVIIEFMKTRLERVGSIVGIFYGINVLGAATGALLTGIYLIEIYGLHGTSLIAATLNFICAFGFLVALRATGARNAANASAPTRNRSVVQILALSGVPRSILVASFLFGFVTLGMEMVIFRIISNYFTPWPPLFAFMLAVFLLMLAMGEFIVGTIVDRIKAEHVWLLLLALMVGSIATILAQLHVPLLYIHDGLGIDQFAVYNQPFEAILLIAAFMVPILFIAGFLPVVVKVSTKDIKDVGPTFATILFVFTVGNMFGSFITAIVFFEIFGSLASILICMLMTAAGIFLLFHRTEPRRRIPIVAVSAVSIAVLAMLIPWNYYFQSTGYLRAHFQSTGLEGAAADVAPIEVMEDRESVTVIVPDRNIYHVRPLWGNSALTTADLNVGQSVWSLSHLMALDPTFRPRRILQIGTGGAQFAYAMKEWSFVEEIVVVELNEAVLAAHAKYSHPDIGGLVNNTHPKVRYVHTDGRRYVQKALARGEKFDLIQIGVNNLKQVGTNNIYSLDFLRKIKELTSADGYVALFSYTGLARMGLELWDQAFVFPEARNWVMLSNKAFPADGATLAVDDEVARFYTSGNVEQLKNPPPATLNDLKVNFYRMSDALKPYEISTDDNLAYEYWMLRTRRGVNNNPEVYLYDQGDKIPYEQRTYRVCLQGAGCNGPSASLTPFIQTLKAEQMLRFSLLEDGGGFLSILEKQIDANAEATRNTDKPLPPASEVFDKREGRLRFFKTPVYRHHSNIVGREELPLISLGDARYLTVRLSYRPDGGQGRTYWNMLWTDEAGAVIASLENYYLRLFIDNEKLGQDVVEQFEHIPVPLGARGVRLDMAFSNVFSMDIQSLEILGDVLQTAPAASAHVTEDQGVTTIGFTAAGDGGPYLGRGARLVEPDVAAAYRLSTVDGPEAIVPGRPVLLNNFQCHQVILVRPDMSRASIRVTGADELLVSVDRGALILDAYEYSASERLFETLAPLPEAGVFRNRNLGASDELPAGALRIAISDSGDSFVCPSWQPEGRLASLVITEHADLVSTRHSEQLYYGNLDRKRVEGQGFVGNDLPITTTVFALGPNRDIAVEGETYREEPLETTPSLETLINAARADGYPLDIGLHTPSTGLDSQPAIEAALKYVQRFNASVWIDHGLIGNLESLSRQGWDARSSDYYLPKLMEHYGIKYAWSSTDKPLTKLDLIREGLSANFFYEVPAFKNKASGWSLNLFGAVQTQLPNIKEEDLDALIEARGVSILHIYLQLFSFSKGVIKDEALAAIRRIAMRRDDGDLHVATLPDWARHVTAMRKADIALTPDGFRVVSGADVPGATFVVTRLDGALPSDPSVASQSLQGSRAVGASRYYWVDLKAGVPMQFNWTDA